ALRLGRSDRGDRHRPRTDRVPRARAPPPESPLRRDGRGSHGLPRGGRCAGADRAPGRMDPAPHGGADRCGGHPEAGVSDAKDPCGVSTWAAFPFALIVAVLMPPSPRAPTLAAQEGPVADTSAESLARGALQEYRESVFEGWRRRVRSTPPGAIGPMQGTRLETCRGSTLEACFGGELHCAWWGRMCDATPHAADRAHLLARLEALQKRFPGSNFVVGHLVDVALTAGDPRRALEAAERCGGTAWWCQALRGYARHARIPGS